MQKLKLSVLVLMPVLFSLMLKGQGLTLSRAIDDAMVLNLDIKTQQQRVMRSDAYNKSAFGWFMPKVTLTGGYTWFNRDMEINMGIIKPALDDVAGVYGASIAKDLGLSNETQEEIYQKIVNGLGKLPDDNISFNFSNFPNASLNVVQPLFTGGRIVSAKNTASLTSNISRINMSLTKNTVTKKIVDAYFLTVLLEKVVETRRLAVKDIGKHVDYTRKMIKKGVLSKYDELRAQVALSAAQRELDDEISGLDIARSALNLSIGYAEDTVLNLADSLYFKAVNIDVEELKRQARSTLPVFQMQQQRKLLAEQNYNARRAKMFPEIFAYANYSFFNDYLPVVPAPLTAGVQLRYNIFNGGSDYKKLQAGKFMIREAEINAENTAKKVDFMIDKAYKQVLSSRNRYVKLESTVKLAEENYRITKKRLEQGLARSVDVLDAYTLLEDTRVERLFSLYAYYLAINNLYYACGQSDKIVEILK